MLLRGVIVMKLQTRRMPFSAVGTSSVHLYFLNQITSLVACPLLSNTRRRTIFICTFPHSLLKGAGFSPTGKVTPSLCFYWLPAFSSEQIRLRLAT